MAKGYLVAALLLVSGCTSLPQTTAEQYAVTDDQWDLVCTKLDELGYEEVDCSKTPRPTVVISEVVVDSSSPGTTLYGFHYPGEDYIFLNPDFPELWDSIVVHEMTHYLLTQTYGMSGMPGAVSHCQSEHIARVVHHAREGTPYDPLWRVYYGCTI